MDRQDTQKKVANESSECNETKVFGGDERLTMTRKRAPAVLVATIFLPQEFITGAQTIKP